MKFRNDILQGRIYGFVLVFKESFQYSAIVMSFQDVVMALLHLLKLSFLSVI